LGLRGTGKTVLLNKIERLAEGHGHLTSFIEAPDDKRLVELLYPKIHQVLRKLSLIESAKATAYAAMQALRAFASAFKIALVISRFPSIPNLVPPTAESSNTILVIYSSAWARPLDQREKLGHS
jgi:hypothetical protein